MAKPTANGRCSTAPLDDGRKRYAGAQADELSRFVRTASVDRVTASTVALFEEHGISATLLKGAGFAHLLYRPHALRDYTDSDLLVAVADRQRAEELLRRLGFARIDSDADWLEPSPKYAHTFFRGTDGAFIDLHWTISGVGTTPEEVWSTLQHHREQVRVGGRMIWSLDAVASAVLIALHNAHHGNQRPQTLADLDRALDRLDFGTWTAARSLASDLDALASFVSGLRLTGPGNELAARLALAQTASTDMWFKTHEGSHGATVIDALSRTSSLRGRLRLFWRVLAPRPEMMRAFFPLARRGPVGLAGAYLVRPLHLVASTLPAALEWLRARRTAGHGA